MDTDLGINKNGMVDYLSDFKDCLVKSKKSILMYIIMIALVSFLLLGPNNYAHPKTELVVMGLIVILGIFSIVLHYKNGNEKLYVTAFVVILIFGLVCCLVTPIISVSDEGEHLMRAEITSRGVLFPEYVNESYESISAMNFFAKSNDLTVLQVDGDTDKINHTADYKTSVFEQNPFLGYAFSGLGIFFAKLLDLNVIWILWLGRIFNTLFYAITVSYAIKKTPIYKVPIFAIACLPVCLFQAYSVSIDCIVTGLGILVVAYFFNMCENKFTTRDILIVACLSLFAGLCKLPYLGLALLLLFAPTKNFNEDDKKRYYAYAVLGIVLVLLVGIMWSKLVATPALSHSWRAQYMIENNVNISNQLNYIICHPFELFTGFFNYISKSFNNIFSMFAFYSYSRGGEYVPSQFISTLNTLFFGLLCFGYPVDKKIDLKSKIGALFTFIVVFVGICITMLLSWSPVGQLTFAGIHTRYFLPLFALLPFVCGINISSVKGDSMDYPIITMTILFISAMIISLTALYY